MGVRSKEDVSRFTSLARKMYFSNETIDSFLAQANAAQVRCVCDLVEHELEVRERNKRQRLFRKASFPRLNHLTAMISPKWFFLKAILQTTSCRWRFWTPRKTSCFMARPVVERLILPSLSATHASGQAKWRGSSRRRISCLCSRRPIANIRWKLCSKTSAKRI